MSSSADPLGSGLADVGACICARFGERPGYPPSVAVHWQCVPRPQRGFSRAMRRMRRCSSAGIAGRPGWDVRRHSNFQALRCLRSNVSGRTTTNASRQSKSLDSSTSRTRVTGSIRRGLTPRSMYRVSCRRRKRFSALIDRLDRTISRSHRSASQIRARRTVMPVSMTESCHTTTRPSLS